MSEEHRNPGALAEVGRFTRKRDANDRGLVVLSMGLAYWIVREANEHVLYVREQHREVVARELEKYEAEWREQPPAAIERQPVEKSKVSLFVFAWVMALFFIAQRNAPPWWMER